MKPGNRLARIERTDTVENGAIAVALVDNEEATLKRVRRKGGAIALEPANKNYETRIFPPERVKIQGRLVGLLRSDCPLHVLPDRIEGSPHRSGGQVSVSRSGCWRVPIRAR